MSDAITKEEVNIAFQEASECLRAERCKKAAEAMCLFYRLDNQHTIESGKGMFHFTSMPEGPCPNQDQLLCQDRLEAAL